MLSQGLGVYHMASRNTSIGSVRKMRVLGQRQTPDLVGSSWRFFLSKKGGQVVVQGWISFAIRLISKGERSGLLTQSQRWKHKIISRLCSLVRLRIWNGTKERNTDTAAT